MVEDILRKALKKAIAENVEFRNNIIEENVGIFKDEISSLRFFKLDKNKIFVQNLKEVIILTFEQEKIIKDSYISNSKLLEFNEKNTYLEIKSHLHKLGERVELFKLSDLEKSMIGFFNAEFECILPEISKYLNKRYSKINSSLSLVLLKTMRLLFKNSQENFDPEIKNILSYLGVKNNQSYNKIFLDNKERVIKLLGISHYFLLYYMSIVIKKDNYDSEYIENVYKALSEPSSDLLLKIEYLDRYNFKRLYAKSYSINSILFFVECILNSDIKYLTDYSLEDINNFIHYYQIFGDIKYMDQNHFKTQTCHHIIKEKVNINRFTFNHMFKGKEDDIYTKKSRNKNLNFDDSFILLEIENSLNEYQINLDFYKQEIKKKEQFLNFILEDKLNNYIVPRSRNYKVKKIKNVQELHDYSYANFVNNFSFDSYSYHNIKNIIFYEYYSKENNEYVGSVCGFSTDGLKYTFKDHFPKLKNLNYIKKILPKYI